MGMALEDHETTRVIIIGSSDGINTGFAAAIRAEGWQCSEVSDVAEIDAYPHHTRMLLIMRVRVFTRTAYQTMKYLADDLGLPIIVFSDRNEPEIVSETLKSGAEDFIHVPVTIEEAIARLSAIIRVYFGDSHGTGRWQSDYTVDSHQRTVSVAGSDAIQLSLSEYRLFCILFSARNHPVTRERLFGLHPSFVGAEEGGALDATARRLRRKLGTGRMISAPDLSYELVDHRPVRVVTDNLSTPEPTHLFRNISRHQLRP